MADSIIAPLGRPEHEIIVATENGDWVNFSDAESEAACIPAAFLRRLLLGQVTVYPEGGPPRPCVITVSGIRIKGARIVGLFDLADCSPVGGLSLPNIRLENCLFESDVDFSGSHLGNLSLRSSRVRKVALRNAKIEGAFDFSNLTPSGIVGNSFAWIDAHGIVIAGEAIGTGAKLRSPPPRADVGWDDEHFALRLSAAHVVGCLSLDGGFEALGGVSISTAKIGMVLAFRAVLFAKEGSALEARGAKIAGTLVLNWARTQGRISLPDARIGGMLTMIGASFDQAPEKQDPYTLFALGIRVGGDVAICNDFKSRGCVLLSRSRIGGFLNCSAGTFEDVSKDGSTGALIIEQATIRCGLFLRSKFVATGRVNLNGTTVGLALDCSDAIFRRRALPEQASKEIYASMASHVLSGESMQVGDAAMFSRCRAEGSVSFLGAKFGGNLILNGGRFFATKKEPGSKARTMAINAEYVTVDGAVIIEDNFLAIGLVNFTGARIKGHFGCSNCHCFGVDGDAVVAQSAQIGGSFRIRDGFYAQGGVNLLGSRIEGDLNCSAATIEAFSGNNTFVALTVVNAKIGGRVWLNNSFVCIGSISLWGSSIGQDLDCRAATFVAWAPRPLPDTEGISLDPNFFAAINGTNLAVGGDVFLADATVLGHLSFERAKIAGSLVWNGVNFPLSVILETSRVRSGKVISELIKCEYYAIGPVVDGPAVEMVSFEDSGSRGINLSAARIGGALKAHYLTADVPITIDLRAAQADRLSDEGQNASLHPFPSGWGEGGEHVVPYLRLDGFMYREIEQLANVSASVELIFKRKILRLLHVGTREPDAGYKNRYSIVLLKRFSDVANLLSRKVSKWWFTGRGRRGDEAIYKARLQWLERQKRGSHEQFNPQPYRQLAAVMRTQGYSGAARLTAIAEQRKSRQTGFTGLLWPVFGATFGFGLSSSKASRTVIFTLAITTSVVWLAWKQPVLVLSPALTATKSAEEQLVGLRRPHVIERECGRHDISPLLYALDMMLPVLSLHQVERCEVANRPGTTGWQIVWALTSIIGKVVTSLALVTYAGIMKPRDG